MTLPTIGCVPLRCLTAGCGHYRGGRPCLDPNASRSPTCSIADLKRLLAFKEKTAGLEEKKAKLEAELAKVDAQLKKLGVGAKPVTRRGRKPGRKPGRRPGRPAAKKAVRRLGKKVGRRVVKRAKAPARKKAAVKRPAKPGIQDVVVALIRENGKPMAFQAILGAIQQRKLVKTKSKNFQNVLRRVLSTSTKVKRAGRGIYAVKG